MVCVWGGVGMKKDENKKKAKIRHSKIKEIKMGKKRPKERQRKKRGRQFKQIKNKNGRSQ